jgi:trigger factor
MTEHALKVEIEDLSEIKRRVKIEVPAAEVTQEVDRAYRDLGKKAKVKGFRPGKVPRSILEMYYRKQVEQEVSDSLVRRSLGEALKEKDLEPIGMSWPEALPQVVAGEDYRFSVELEVPPQFTVENYQGLSLQDPGAEVGDEMVEARLEEIRQSSAMLQPLKEDRGIQEGDFVVLAYQGHYAGQALPEAKAENQYLEVGSGKFNLEFEKNLMGLKAGGESRFSVALPDDFANPLLAGKVVEFAVKVHEVKEKVVPDLDDAFARTLGGNFQGLPELRQAIRDDMIKGKEREREAGLESQALDQLLAAHSFPVPPSMVRQEQENLLREQYERLSQYGAKLEGMDLEKMRAVLQPLAERRVRNRLVLERIAAQEGITVDDAELEASLADIAAKSGREVAQLREFYREHDLMETLRRQLKEEKTMKFILDKATLVQATPQATEEKA